MRVIIKLLLYKKIPANTGRHDIFQKFIERWTLENKHFIEFTRVCRQGKLMQEKHKKTSENARTHNTFRAFTERWTLGNMRFLEFPWIRRLGKYKKTGENFCKRANALCFPYVNQAVHPGKQCVLRNLPAFAVLKTGENAGFQLLTPDEREVLHQENICEHRQTRHSPSVNRPVLVTKFCMFLTRRGTVSLGFFWPV